MITGIASKVADFFICRNWIQKDEYEIYRYGVEVILSFALNFCIVLICALIFGEIFYTFLFYAVFLLMRKFCGGYHADTYLRCNMIFAVNVILVELLLKVPNEVSNHLLFLAIVSSVLLIGKFTPIVNSNKPVDSEKQRKYRKIAMGLLGIFVLLIICMFPVQRKASLSIILSLFSVAFAMLVEKIKNLKKQKKKVKRYEGI